MSELTTKLNSKKIQIFLILTVLSIVIAFFKLGFGLSLWLIFILWLIIYLIFFVRPITKIVNGFWLAITIVFIFSMLVAFGVIFNNNSDEGLKSADGIILDECTSTTKDNPLMLYGWKSTIYSAPYSKTTSPGIEEANNVRVFSYSGIKDKTELNSLYSRIERTDGSNITGYGTTIEVCDANNKTTKSYITANTTYIASDNVVASTHYFHGGNYLHGAGDYRVDVYIRTKDGKWHLVDRMSGITVIK